MGIYEVANWPKFWDDFSFLSRTKNNGTPYLTEHRFNTTGSRKDCLLKLLQVTERKIVFKCILYQLTVKIQWSEVSIKYHHGYWMQQRRLREYSLPGIHKDLHFQVLPDYLRILSALQERPKILLSSNAFPGKVGKIAFLRGIHHATD